jgi:hypothetical protein
MELADPGFGVPRVSSAIATPAYLLSRSSADYATRIARDWNTKDSRFAGCVTSFQRNHEYLATFERHIVGSVMHEECWMPSEQLPDFNGVTRVTQV